ncbi:hypothetical protein [uncultured Cohaesibacter sp.]|uniref:hypothetical protein n=1 Tax=uncultured Cohaesibacter sp. TaxID=1002546 RepID=UPI0029C68309|nr:hypothetical protein [uncultured Cohaesibacter sp.]
MKKHSNALALAAICLLATLTGCATDDRRLEDAAIKQGIAEARAILPKLPEQCRKEFAHAGLTVGGEIRSVLKRERRQLDLANATIRACAVQYDKLREELR